MIKKIFLSGILICLFIAIPLALLGIKKVDLGEPFLALMTNVNRDLNEWHIAIPDISQVPYFEAQGWKAVLNVFIFLLNMLISIVNIISSLLNVVIQLFQCIFFIVKELINFKDNLENYQISSSWPSLLII